MRRRRRRGATNEDEGASLDSFSEEDEEELPIEPDVLRSPRIEAMRKKPTLGAGTEMTSIRQWMARHGDPKPAPNGFYSEFQNDRKIYGGTNHHKAFKTQSTTMKRGMMTR